MYPIISSNALRGLKGEVIPLLRDREGQSAILHTLLPPTVLNMTEQRVWDIHCEAEHTETDTQFSA